MKGQKGMSLIEMMISLVDLVRPQETVAVNARLTKIAKIHP